MRLNCTGSWTDYSTSVGVSKMKIVKSLNAENDPIRNQVGSIEVWGVAYKFIYDNLINSADLYSNSICVRVTDTLCGSTQTIFKLENESLNWCDNGECTKSFSMVEYSTLLDCIKQTTIADNTNGDFQDYPVNGMVHPRFRYCDVFKPTFVFGMLLTFANAVDTAIAALNGILSSLNLILSAINVILGTSFSIGLVPYVGVGIIGCDRGFPAPFVRTYIDNVCDICGVTSNISTNPILYDIAGYYYEACLLTAYTTKGVSMAGSKDYIVSNQPSWTLYQLMSKIKVLWNARYFIKGTELHFNRKDLIGVQLWGSTPAIDFTTTNDKNQLIGNVCYSWNGEGKIRRLNLNYITDATDAAGNELLKRFNGEYIDPSSNPNYKEAKEVTAIDFGAHACVLDGQDSLYDANVVNSMASIFSQVDLGGCLKTTTDTIGSAKIVILRNDGDYTDCRIYGVPYTPYIGLPEFVDDSGSVFPILPGDLKNYSPQMSFSPNADAISDNLWQYWQIEKPANGKKTNIKFSFKLNYCCSFNSLELYQSVQFENGDIGEIDFIEFDFSERVINIKGNLM